MSKTRYVLMVAIDPATAFTVGLTKKKGPAFLLNRVTFPGGKVEDGEDDRTAARREMREETGLDIPESDWVVYDIVEKEDRIIVKLAAVSNKVLHARAMEEEPVWHLAIASHQQYAARQPDQYAPDFLRTLQGALDATAEAIAA